MASGRDQFGSRRSAVMAMAGSAIGLGNLWRFPYMVGQNGGAVFIIVYLLAALFLSIPIMLCESVIGRSTQSNTFGAMEKLAPGTRWKWLGLLTVISPLIILSYYSVVGGWSIEYLGQSLINGFGSDISGLFGIFITSSRAPLLFHTVFLLLTCGIVLAGVKGGIERFNKISLPALFVLILIITAYSISLPGAVSGVSYLVKPDFSKLSAGVISSAVGQSFFSLSLGVGTMLTYASYMRKEDNIVTTGLGTAAFDLLFALIAGFAIMPAVFAAGIKPDAGPGLIFETLPYIFAQMGTAAPLLSRIISILFFLTVVIAALTSSISMCEVGVAYLVEEKKMSRLKATSLVFFGTWTLGCLCSLSFGPLSGIKILDYTIFNFCDRLTSNFLMIFGSLLFVIFVGWKMKKELVRSELACGKLFGLLYFLIRYAAPVAILVIFFTGL